MASAAVVALSAAVAPAASAAPASTQSTHVSVNVSCAPGGRYAFNGAIVDAPPYQTYSVTYSYQENSPGGSGGGWGEPMGSVYTGAYGIGSTNTVVQYAPADATSVTVWITINGITGSSSDTC